MSRNDKFNDALGQHMTPATIAKLVARFVPSTVRVAIDLAVGDGALLRAHFSDRGRLFQSDRGRRFSVIVDAPGCAQAMGFNVSQSSTIRLKRLSRSGR